ncbi:MAG: SDR family NAD(P)-dependent oxidoreductase [Myxococcota bacterium]
MDLQGKAALITGAGTGVGAATARQLAERGCSVLANYSRSKEGAEKTAVDCEARGVKAFAHQADVADDTACRAMVERAVGEFGRLDLLVNNAGTTEFIPHANLEDVTPEAWQKILGVNLMGPFFCTRAAAEALKADGGGEVVNVSSIAGLAGMGSSIPYCASKGGLNNLTVTMARVLAPDVRVNAVAPGFIDGAWLQEGLGPAYDAVKQGFLGRTPLQKVPTPDDVATAILSVVEGSDFLTGHVVPCEGGMLIGT